MTSGPLSTQYQVKTRSPDSSTPSGSCDEDPSTNRGEVTPAAWDGQGFTKCNLSTHFFIQMIFLSYIIPSLLMTNLSICSFYAFSVIAVQFSLPAIRNLAKSWRLSCKPRMRSADSIPMCRLEFVFFHWKCTQVLQKSLSLSIKHACFKRYHHDLLRHLVAFSKFEWFISSDHKIKNFSTHYIHKL